MKSILFLGLKVFSATGGIEKVCRVAGKALSDKAGDDFMMIVLHDSAPVPNRYIPPHRIRSCSGSIPIFFLRALQKSRRAKVVILSHVNLLPVGWLIKKLFPGKKLVLLLHGIEVWNGVGNKSGMLKACDLFISVSRYTAERFSAATGTSSDRIKILNNCLDPYLPPPVSKTGRNSILTLTRLAHTERAKGYDDVIRALGKMKNTSVRYIIAGKYTPDEYAHIKELAASEGVSEQVEITGYVQDDDIPSLFADAGVYVMPSTKEGFGIVFVEAMFYGTPVIGSGIDGSADALRDGAFGISVKPGEPVELAREIEKVLSNPAKYIPSAEKVKEEFGFINYSRKLHEIIETL